MITIFYTSYNLLKNIVFLPTLNALNHLLKYLNIEKIQEHYAIQESDCFMIGLMKHEILCATGYYNILNFIKL